MIFLLALSKWLVSEKLSADVFTIDYRPKSMYNKIQKYKIVHKIHNISKSTFGSFSDVSG